MSTNDSEQGQRPDKDDKTRKLKYWGWILVGLGLISALFLFYIGIGFYLNTGVKALIYFAIGFCGIGLILFFTAKGHPSIVALFIIVSLPIFIVISLAVEGRHHQARGHQAEGKAGLGYIFTAATAIKKERKTFVISDISQLDYEPYGSPRYSFWYAVNGVPTMIPSANLVKGPCDVTTPPTSVKVAASATGFTAAAKGNIDDDATCDEWSINDRRELKNTLNDLRN